MGFREGGGRGIGGPSSPTQWFAEEGCGGTRGWVRSKGQTHAPSLPHPAYARGDGDLAYTRYCHDQYCTVYGIHKGGRSQVVYCVKVVQ